MCVRLCVCVCLHLCWRRSQRSQGDTAMLSLLWRHLHVAVDYSWQTLFQSYTNFSKTEIILWLYLQTEFEQDVVVNNGSLIITNSNCREKMSNDHHWPETKVQIGTVFHVSYSRQLRKTSRELFLGRYGFSREKFEIVSFCWFCCLGLCYSHCQSSKVGSVPTVTER